MNRTLLLSAPPPSDYSLGDLASLRRRQLLIEVAAHRDVGTGRILQIVFPLDAGPMMVAVLLVAMMMMMMVELVVVVQRIAVRLIRAASGAGARVTRYCAGASAASFQVLERVVQVGALAGRQLSEAVQGFEGICRAREIIENTSVIVYPFGGACRKAHNKYDSTHQCAGCST